MKKRFLPAVLALLLLCAGCQEQAPGESVASNVENAQQEQEQSEASAAMEEGGMKQIGDTLLYKDWVRDEDGQSVESQVEYTILKAQIFDHPSDAGVSEEDCCYGYKDTPFILVDVKAKKLTGPEKMVDESSMNSISCFGLTNRESLERLANGEEAIMSPEMCYFSGHPENDETQKNYCCYWLDVGEEKVFQMGWCLHDGSENGPRELDHPLIMEPEGLLLNLYLGDSSYLYIDVGL